MLWTVKMSDEFGSMRIRIQKLSYIAGSIVYRNQATSVVVSVKGAESFTVSGVAQVTTFVVTQFRLTISHHKASYVVAFQFNVTNLSCD